jgi:hypothetical protein
VNLGYGFWYVHSSIFFITTYFSDYILVPIRSRNQVIRALEDRGFQFEHTTSSYVNPAHNRSASTQSFETLQRLHTKQGQLSPPPGTPPPTSIQELEARTFAMLKRRGVSPTVDSKLRLVQCAGRKNPSFGISSGTYSYSNGSGNARNSGTMSSSADDGLHLGIVRSLIVSPSPSFISLTLTDTEPISLLLSQSLLANFPPDTLLGATSEEYLIPISLDLRELPEQSTGIVCGVAGRLVGGTRGGLSGGGGSGGSGGVEMSYLSTARAGTVMVGEEERERALKALGASEGDGEVGTEAEAQMTIKWGKNKLIFEGSENVKISLQSVAGDFGIGMKRWQHIVCISGG